MPETTWKMHEVNGGAEIFLTKEDLESKTPLTRPPEPGEKIIVFHPMASWCQVNVRRDTYGVLEGWDGANAYPLRYCEDKKCWTSFGAINLSAVVALSYIRGGKRD